MLYTSLPGLPGTMPSQGVDPWERLLYTGGLGGTRGLSLRTRMAQGDGKGDSGGIIASSGELASVPSLPHLMKGCPVLPFLLLFVTPRLRGPGGFRSDQVDGWGLLRDTAVEGASVRPPE